MQSMLHRFRVEQVAGVLLMVLGATVMTGWLLRMPLLVQLKRGEVGMVFNTALAFVLSGSLLTGTAAGPRRSIACILLVFALCIGAQDLFRADFGIDRWLVEAWLADPNPYPGRMAPQTAACFALTGMVVLLLTFRRRPWSSVLTQLLIFVIGTAGIVGLVGYTLRLELLYSWYRYSRMALHTAGGFTLLALALWVSWYRWNVLAGAYEENDDRRVNAIGAGLIVLVAVSAGTAGFALLAQQTERLARLTLMTQLDAQREALLSVLQERNHDATALTRSTALRQALVELRGAPSAQEPRDEVREWAAANLGGGVAAIRVRLPDGGPIRTPLQSLMLYLLLLVCGTILLLRWQVAPLVRKISIARAESAANGARVAAIMNSVPDGIVTTNEHGRIESWNRGAERIFGSSAAAILGRNLRELLCEPHQPVYEAYLRGHANLAAAQRLELEARHSDGSAFPIDLGMSEMSIGEERLFIHVMRDISERREVDRIKGEFVSVVSHELRTPLTSISGSLGLMAGGAVGELPPQAKRLVDIASQNSERLCRLINDILDLEKAEGGQLELNLAPQSLCDIVRQVIESNQPYAARLGVRIRLESVAADAQVAIDRDRFAQVLTNILSNAAKFSPPGETVKVRIETGTAGIRVAVQDRGAGIPDSFRSRIFQRFAQADGSDARAKGGTGLGLSIAKSLTERHGGQISYESSSAGTTFSISLPIHQVSIDAHTAA